MEENTNTISFSEIRLKGSLPDLPLVGYRCKVVNKKAIFDFTPDLLEYICSSLYGNLILLGVRLFAVDTGDFYVTQEEDKVIEIETKADWDKYFKSLNLSGCSMNSLSSLRLHYLICRQKMYDANIPVGIVSNLSINSRLNSVWGRCRWYKTHSNFDIEISERLMLAGDSTGIECTIIHELLHTCEGCLNHGKLWKEYASIVSMLYGYPVSRISDAETLGVDIDVLLEQGYYACRCKDCGNIIPKKSLCNFIKHPENYCCGCGGEFERIDRR